MTIEEIEIQRYKSPIVQWYKNDGTYLGELYNEHEFNRLRVELFRHNLHEECYFMWGDKKITIDSDGSMSEFPKGLYDMTSQFLSELFKLKMERRGKTF